MLSQMTNTVTSQTLTFPPGTFCILPCLHCAFVYGFQIKILHSFISHETTIIMICLLLFNTQSLRVGY
jgi:hypothetical protein